MVPFSPVRLSSLHQILSSLSSLLFPLLCSSPGRRSAQLVEHSGHRARMGGRGMQVVAAAVMAVSGLCALPRKKKKANQLRSARGVGADGDSEGGMGRSGGGEGRGHKGEG